MSQSDSGGTISELQLLISMYDRSQVHFDDTHLAAHLESLTLSVEDEASPMEDALPPSGIVRSTTSLTVTPNEHLKIDIRIPIGYPKTEKLSAHCTLSYSNKAAGSEMETKINQELLSRVRDGEPPGLSILELIDFCKEAWDRLEKTMEESVYASTLGSGQFTSAEEEKTSRLWIHSHHIYNRNKRKFLVEVAEELNLSGISCPGKPGFVCVEGREEDCDEYWTRVRQLTWQKISLISKEHNIQRAFRSNSFEELRCDKSQFIKYLEERNLSAVIKDYLGFS